MTSTLDNPCVKKLKIENGTVKVQTNDYSTRKIKVGSRKSQLALFQSNFVVELLKKNHSGISYEIITMNTTGDKILNVALSKIGEKGLFTKELEIALERRDVHIVVHSLKDLPTSLPAGMVIGAICKREDPCDVVIFRPDLNCRDLKDLPPKSVIGTSSLRRVAQLKRRYPHLDFLSIRGNLNTRFRKLDEDKIFSAIILAAAGVQRLDLAHRIGQVLQPEQCMYAVGQGALGIECKDDDLETIQLLSSISDPDTTLRCIAERAFLKRLEGGCSVPIAVNSVMENKKLTLEGGVFSLDGSQSICEKVTVVLPDTEDNIFKKNFVGVVAPHIPSHFLNAAETLGIELAELLAGKGAKEILKEARQIKTII